MRKSILTLGIAAVLTGVLATCSMTYAADDELAQIQESGKLKVGVEGTYPPYTYHDDNGELTGFDVEVAKAIADKLGVEADFTESDWDSLLAGIDSGRLDTVINAVSITPEREEKYDFAGPYFYITQQIVVAKDNDDIVDMASLDGKKVANTATTAYLDILEDAGASLVQISTADEAVSLIESGRADFTTYAVPIKKGETALYDAVQNAIDELKEDGTLSKLSEDYFGTDFTQPQDENAANTDTASEDATTESTDEN